MINSVDEKVRETVEGSGHDFQYSVEGLLKSKGWITTPSPYYVDLAQRKSREIDIVATKTHGVLSFYSQGSENVMIRFFVECKHIKNPCYFWFIKKDKSVIAQSIVDDSAIHFDDKMQLFGDGQNAHHYLQDGDVARNWKCEGRPDYIYDAWEQSLHAMIYYKQNKITECQVIDYPVIVVDSFDKFFKKAQESNEISQIESNFLLSIDYSYPVLNKDKSSVIDKKYFIDIIDFNKLEEFLDNFENNDLDLLKNAAARELDERDFKKRTAKTNRTQYI